MFRANGVFASDERSRGGGKPNSVFLYFADGTTDAQVIARFQTLEAQLNAKLVSINKQIASYGYNDLPEGLPGELVKVLLKNNTTGAVENISWVFGAPGATEAAIENALDPALAGNGVLLNRYGDDLGEVIRVTRTPLSEE